MTRRNSSRVGRQRGATSLGTVVVLSLSLAVSTIAWAASATPPDLLTQNDRELLARLGPGVIGKPIAPPSEKEIAAAVVRPRSARFRMVAGPRAGQTIEVTTKSARELPDGSAVKKPTWVIDIPDVMTQYMVMDEVGLTAPAVLLRSAGLFSEYQPIEPLLIFGLGPGESKTYPSKAAARHVSKPKEVAYGGEVTVTYRNLGAYEIKTPAGTFPGLVIRIQCPPFHGWRRGSISRRKALTNVITVDQEENHDAQKRTCQTLTITTSMISLRTNISRIQSIRNSTHRDSAGCQ